MMVARPPGPRLTRIIPRREPKGCGFWSIAKALYWRELDGAPWFLHGLFAEEKKVKVDWRDVCELAVTTNFSFRATSRP